MGNPQQEASLVPIQVLLVQLREMSGHDGVRHFLQFSEVSKQVFQRLIYDILRISACTLYIFSPCNGYLLPKTFIENNNNEKGCDWTCTKCPNVFSAYSVQDLLERIGKDLADIPKGVSMECKKFINDYESLLHPNHFYLTDVKFALSQIIGQEGQGGLPAVSDEDLELKARLCQGLTNLFRILIPGKTVIW